MALCIFCAEYSRAQSPYDDEVCLDKTVKQLKQEEQKKKLLVGVNKALIGFSYLNYSDRTVDRISLGREVYEPYANKIVRSIFVKVIDPYGVSIEQPMATKFTKFQKFANRVQMKTKDWVVRNDLLFKEGEPVNPLLFADTEKNLWERGTFKDLKIFMLPVEGSDQLIDVLVMVQDRWSWSINTSIAYNKVQAGVQFKNFLGLPQSISNYVSLNFRKDNLYSVYGNYLYENIKRSQIDAQVKYIYDNFTKGGEVKITRKFFSANSKWAGHIKAGVYQESRSLPNPLAPSIPTNVFYNEEDVWLATAIKIPGKISSKFDLLRCILSARMYRIDYINTTSKNVFSKNSS